MVVYQLVCREGLLGVPMPGSWNRIEEWIRGVPDVRELEPNGEVTQGAAWHYPVWAAMNEVAQVRGA